jgi:hypothetical protein
MEGKLSVRFKKKNVEDVIGKNISADETSILTEIAIYTVDQIAPTLARSAQFDLSDFYAAQARGIVDFTLALSRQTINGMAMWTAEFARGEQNLRVLLTIG